MSLVALLSALVAAWPVGPAQAGRQRADLPLRPFAPTSPWNAPLADHARLTVDSALIVGRLRAQMASAVPWLNTTSYSTPVYTVGPRRARVTVVPDTGNPALAAAFAAVPLPAGARPAAGSDGSLVLWQPATDTLWEFWRLRRLPDGWHAAWGGRIDRVSQSDGVFPAPYGTSASGMALLGGLIRPAEMRAGEIPHALALGVPNAAPSFVAPATRSDGRTIAGIPLGTHLRLPADLDVGALGLPAPVATIARAAQRYGIFVRDSSGAIPFYAQDPVNLRADPWPRLLGFQSPRRLLARFPWDRLQVVAP